MQKNVLETKVFGKTLFLGEWAFLGEGTLTTRFRKKQKVSQKKQIL